MKRADDLEQMPAPSRIEVTKARGRSRLTVCESVAPTKILHPQLSQQSVCAMLSSFGGGMLQGDQVELQMDIREQASLLLRTQANSRVYKNTKGAPTRVHLEGRLAQGAQAIVLPDPVVMHAGSRLHQTQRWQLEDGAALLLGDWFQSGRSDSGECFQFSSYQNHIEIFQQDELILWEPTEILPQDLPPEAPGRFGSSQLQLNLFGVGAAASLLEESLASLTEQATAQTQVKALGSHPAQAEEPFHCSLASFPERKLTVFRALGQSRGDFDPVFRRLRAPLMSETWLKGGESLLPQPVAGG